MRRKNVDVFGFNFVNFESIDDVVDAIFSPVPCGSLPIVCTPNVEQLVLLDSDSELKNFLSRSFILIADGMPIVWVSNILKSGLVRRLSGSDLFPVFWARCRNLGKSVFFVVATAELGMKLRDEDDLCSYSVPPVLNVDTVEFDEYVRRLASEILEFNPDFVVVGISYPKREKLCKALLSLVGERTGSVYLLLGAAPEFHLNIKKRAPLWMQNSGLEWLHRACSEPSRLGVKYLVTGFRFIPLLMSEMLRVQR